MIKLWILLSITTALYACSNNESGNHEGHQQAGSSDKATQDTSRKSIPSEATKWVGNTDIKINYHAPAVRGRVIWGGLVPYDAVWVTGAHSATTFSVGKNFRMGGKNISAGKYALFTIPGKEEWTVILNKNWNQHLADDYSQAEDVVRVKVKPETNEEITERLKYEIDQRGERLADIIISWEKIRVRFDLEIIK